MLKKLGVIVAKFLATFRTKLYALVNKKQPIWRNFALSGHTAGVGQAARIRTHDCLFLCRIFRHLTTPSHSNLSARLTGVVGKVDVEIGNRSTNDDDFDDADVTVNLIDEGTTVKREKTQDTRL